MTNSSAVLLRASPRVESVRCRADLGRSQRVVIKAGTSTLFGADGYPSLCRISQIVESISTLRRAGREVIFVSSGAVAMGRCAMRQQDATSVSTLRSNVFAAAGFSRLMALYHMLFSQLDTTVSDILVTKDDFGCAERRANLHDVLNNLLCHGIVPIVNENDVITAGTHRSTDPFTDNDGLAALVASQMNADLMILLTDVDGLYDRPPSETGARLIITYPGEAAFASIQFGAKSSVGRGGMQAKIEYPGEAAFASIQFGAKSSVGRGGMQAKIEAAMRAIDWGVPAVMVTNGAKPGAIQSVFNGTMSGTLFVEDPTPILEHEKANDVGLAVAQAHQCRDASRPLVDLTEGAANMSLLVVDAACHASDPPRDAHARVTHAR
eukprot:CAMPEP_0174877840 /NCGR_PEP_ID=MMETSP1114-20130205/82458_1 /TAXON_ID=312471 /ORGANISM="Neobodo designis, Strain CCAP 1951/1" /LENGTH=379 /DNA_ID=CAMNT_0016113227 /DNA_START=83 /DNA_END=1222 /DNA_ORIENTATION=-